MAKPSRSIAVCQVGDVIIQKPPRNATPHQAENALGMRLLSLSFVSLLFAAGSRGEFRVCCLSSCGHGALLPFFSFCVLCYVCVCVRDCLAGGRGTTYPAPKLSRVFHPTLRHVPIPGYVRDCGYVTQISAYTARACIGIPLYLTALFNAQGEPADRPIDQQLQLNRMSLRNNWSRFKTPGKLSIIL